MEPKLLEAKESPTGFRAVTLTAKKKSDCPIIYQIKGENPAGEMVNLRRGSIDGKPIEEGGTGTEQTVSLGAIPKPEEGIFFHFSKVEVHATKAVDISYEEVQ